MKALGRTEHENARLIVNELQLPTTPEQYQKDVLSVVLEMLKDAPTMPGIHLI